MRDWVMSATLAVMSLYVSAVPSALSASSVIRIGSSVAGGSRRLSGGPSCSRMPHAGLGTTPRFGRAACRPAPDPSVPPPGSVVSLPRTRERGETGRRAGLRILSREGCGFNSRRSHHPYLVNASPSDLAVPARLRRPATPHHLLLTSYRSGVIVLQTFYTRHRLSAPYRRRSPPYPLSTRASHARPLAHARLGHQPADRAGLPWPPRRQPGFAVSGA